MKYTPLATSVLSLSLLLTGAVPAFAEEGTGGTSVESNTTIHAEGERQSSGGFLQGMKERMNRENDDTKGERMSSTSEERKGDRMEKRLEKGQDKATEAIDKRIESLMKLKERLVGMKLLDATTLATISTALDAEIAKLTALRSQIQSDTSTSTLKADAKRITKEFRIFSVVEPKARIAASASRINAVVAQMNSLVTKFQTRILAAKASGTNTEKADLALIDLQAKIADAKIQADAAVAMTVNLVPDNGDAGIKASNLQALKNARTKLELAHKDLAAARHDAGAIYSVIKGNEGMASTTPHQ